MTHSRCCKALAFAATARCNASIPRPAAETAPQPAMATAVLVHGCFHRGFPGFEPFEHEGRPVQNQFARRRGEDLAGAAGGEQRAVGSAPDFVIEVQPRAFGFEQARGDSERVGQPGGREKIHFQMDDRNGDALLDEHGIINAEPPAKSAPAFLEIIDVVPVPDDVQRVHFVEADDARWSGPR